MTNLTIERLRADVPDTAGSDAAARVDALLHDLADRRLADRIDTLAVGDGEWCIGRLDVTLDLDPTRPDPAIAERWADRLLVALAEALADGAGAVHYRHRGAALTDLVCCLATGRTERAWAWRLLDLLPEVGPDPGDRPGSAATAALGRAPQEALAAILVAAEAVGVDALHRLFGPAGWTELARVLQPAWQASEGGPMSSDRPGRSGLASERTSESEAESGFEAAAESDRPSLGPTARAAHDRERTSRLADAYWRDSRFAAACRRSSIRPEPTVAAAWAVIALTELEPGSRGWAIPDVVDRLAAGFTQPTTVRGAGRPTERDPVPAIDPDRSVVEPSDDGVGPEPGAADPPDPATAAPPEASGAAARSNPARSADPTVDADRGSEDSGPAARDQLPPELEPEAYATAWAGLPYLLTTAEAAGIPDRPRDDPRLADRTLRWILHQIARRLVPIRAGDPAALLMAGLTPDAELPAGGDADRDEDAALTEHARRWAGLTLRRLADAESDEAAASIWWLARRPGEVVADPGWFEVRLGLDQVDVSIRRAGLDLDPGWLGWLGAVVRFRYV